MSFSHKARADALGEALRELWKLRRGLESSQERAARLKVQRRFNLLLACLPNEELLSLPNEEPSR